MMTAGGMALSGPAKLTEKTIGEIRSGTCVMPHFGQPTLERRQAMFLERGSQRTGSRQTGWLSLRRRSIPLIHFRMEKMPFIHNSRRRPANRGRSAATYTASLDMTARAI